MTSKNVFLSEEGLRSMLNSGGPDGLRENNPDFGKNILWSVDKKIELPVVMDPKGFGSIPALTLIGRL